MRTFGTPKRPDCDASEPNSGPNTPFLCLGSLDASGHIPPVASRSHSLKAHKRAPKAKRPITFSGDGASKFWWPGTESNHRHADFQSAALPTELPGQQRRKYSSFAAPYRADGVTGRCVCCVPDSPRADAACGTDGYAPGRSFPQRGSWSRTLSPGGIRSRPFQTHRAFCATGLPG
jgi:hypothetical protein